MNPGVYTTDTVIYDTGSFLAQGNFPAGNLQGQEYPGKEEKNSDNYFYIMDFLSSGLHAVRCKKQHFFAIQCSADLAKNCSCEFNFNTMHFPSYAN